VYPVIIIGNIRDYPGKNVRVIADIGDIRDRVEGIYFYHLEPGAFQGNPAVKPEASYEYVAAGIRWALDKKIQALVTAPISKEKWLNAGITDKGHTGLLARTANVKEHAMFFWSENLKVVLFTIHIPLNQVPPLIKKDEIIRFIRFVSSEMSRLFCREFTYLVCGLNPHAGENGFLGNEEIEEIIPAVEALKPELNIIGPIPPDTIFIKVKDLKDAVVVAWYHDQGLIPFKLLNINTGVNLTLGLPYIRTSPDHGTAYDIAGKGIANPSSMIEALWLAEFLVKKN
jgi:4-hydroxythreonine-4-phosphate dehydrogenase